jgi:molybdenum cofactor biosynthesis protein A
VGWRLAMMRPRRPERAGDSVRLPRRPPQAESLAGTATREADANILEDRFGRVFDYLRIAVTDRCNLRCVYCMPEEGVDFTEKGRLLRSDEILRVVRVAGRLGVRKIRLTGGEPLVRKDIVELVHETVETPGIRKVCLTTNGLLLPSLAWPLRKAGLYGLNISLDTLDPKRFQRCTRRAGIERVMAGLERALALRFPSVKMNVVAIRGFNDDEIDGFARLTRNEPVTVRFIELMPFDGHQIWRTGRFLGTAELVRRFRELYPSSEIAAGSSTEEQVYRIPGHAGKVAFIPSYTRSFCRECTRIRLTADGRIRNCLYCEDEYDLLELLRNGGTDDAIGRTLQHAMWRKPEDGLAAQRQAREKRQGATRVRESMTQIGG